MKRFFILLILFLWRVSLFAQTDWFFRDIANNELKFLTPLETFKNIFPIDNGITVVNGDTIDFK